MRRFLRRSKDTEPCFLIGAYTLQDTSLQILLASISACLEKLENNSCLGSMRLCICSEKMPRIPHALLVILIVRLSEVVQKVLRETLEHRGSAPGPRAIFKWFRQCWITISGCTKVQHRYVRDIGILANVDDAVHDLCRGGCQ